MHCNCAVYFPVIAWNTLEDLQNYSNYSRLYIISSLITGTAQSRKSFFFRKLQNPKPVRVRFLLRKLESGSCRTQPESGSKKSKIQSMHTSAVFPAARYSNFQTEDISILKQREVWNCVKISMIDSIVLS